MAIDKQHQKQFHDEYYSTTETHPQRKYYSVTRRMHQKYVDLVYANCRGKRVLDYCCGLGAESLRLGERGANVVGVDISPVGIERAKEKAAAMGLSEVVHFAAMDAEHLDFEDDAFDIVVGLGALHHLNLDAAYAEIVRVLKPDGYGVFSDPLAYNPAINLYRRITEGARTHDEHRLVKGDFELARKYFEDVHVWFYNLAVLAAVPFRTTPYFDRVLNALERVDDAIFKLPGGGWLAWACVYQLAGPKKQT